MKHFAIFINLKYFQEDLLDSAMFKCLNVMNLLEADEIDEKQDHCISGCMLEELEMV